ncbi:FkbM family methyltransferase [Methylobacterium sp. MA0201]|uniref:FkbM family methyltransferase n=1 Tax=Methylobacterium alsaeris TaxID=3344826 RepID=UPI0037572985
MTSVIAIRTNRWSKDLEDWVYRLKYKSFRSVVILADESGGKVRSPDDIEKIIVDRDFLSNKNLYITDKIFWRCGDYFLIVAYFAFRQADFFWLLDDDTRINSDNLDEFFSRFERSGYDFLAPEFRKYGDYWSWTKTVKWYTEETYGCLFPLTFYSLKAAKIIYESRKKLTETMIIKNIPPDMWPNDEAFTATAVVQAGLKAADFNHVQKYCIIKEIFHFAGMPTSEKEFKNIPPDERVYHPVLSGKAYYNKLIQSLEEILRSKPKAEDVRDIFERIFRNIDNEQFPVEYEYLMQRRKVELDTRQESFLQGTAECVQTGGIYKISFSHDQENKSGISFFVSEISDYIQSYATRGSFYEKECLLMIKDLLPIDGSFLDIGAYNGNHSIYVGFALNAKNIFVCEANPKIANVCATNIFLNGLYDKTDLRGLGVALSNINGKAKIHVPSGNAGSATLHSFNGNDSDITVLRGDELYKDCEIDVIKIDVGDGVIDVLHGLTGIILKSKPSLIVQYSDDRHDEILNIMSRFGYELLKATNPYQGQKISSYVASKRI